MGVWKGLGAVHRASTIPPPPPKPPGEFFTKYSMYAVWAVSIAVVDTYLMNLFFLDFLHLVLFLRMMFFLNIDFSPSQKPLHTFTCMDRIARIDPVSKT
jgi:hypothetical protein